MKTKWIAGLAAMCLVSAIAASVLTVLALLQGAFGMTLLRPQTQATTAASETTGTLTPTPRPTPTSSPTPSPSPVPSITPTPFPTTASSDDPAVVAGLILWQTQALIVKIYEDVSPSVVGIEVEVAEQGSSVRRTNQGSGLIISKDGDIVTNAGILSIALDKSGKVLPNATIAVKIKGIEKTFIATLTGQDVMTGLAVLKIDSSIYALKPAIFSSNSDLKIGQIVLAVGYPEILYESGGLSNGLITALSRTVILEDGISVQMIQTNAPVSLSCSGGPLLNLSGEVIGLTNCAVSREAIDSMSYVLPADTLQSVASDLIENGQVAGRAWLGASVLSEQSFNTLQKTYGFPDGLCVNNVVKDSPAYAADLRKFDVITLINKNKVAKSMDLSKFLQSQPVGTMIEIQVYRRSDNKYHDLYVYLQEIIN
jgi:serine protease Do